MARWKTVPVDGIDLVEYEDSTGILRLYARPLEGKYDIELNLTEAVNLASALLQWATQNRGK